MPAADRVQRRDPDAAHRAAVLRHQSQVHARLLVDLVAAGALQVQQPGQQVGAAVLRHHAAHHRADLRVEEGGHQPPDQALGGQVVGIEDDDEVGVHRLGGVLQRRGLAGLAVGAVEGADAARIALDHRVDDLAGAVLRAVVDRHDDHAVLRIVDAHQVDQAVLDHRLLVVRGHEDRHPRPVGADQAGIGMALAAEHAVQREAVVAHGVDRHQRDDRGHQRQQRPGPDRAEQAVDLELPAGRGAGDRRGRCEREQAQPRVPSRGSRQGLKRGIQGAGHRLGACRHGKDHLCQLVSLCKNNLKKVSFCDRCMSHPLLLRECKPASGRICAVIACHIARSAGQLERLLIWACRLG